jgi:hypothetical protein
MQKRNMGRRISAETGIRGQRDRCRKRNKETKG